MLTIGIPEWRLPRDLCDEEIDQYLAAMGVEIKLNTPIGQTITPDEIEDGKPNADLADRPAAPPRRGLPGLRHAGSRSRWTCRAKITSTSRACIPACSSWSASTCTSTRWSASAWPSSAAASPRWTARARRCAWAPKRSTSSIAAAATRCGLRRGGARGRDRGHRVPLPGLADRGAGRRRQSGRPEVHPQPPGRAGRQSGRRAPGADPRHRVHPGRGHRGRRHRPELGRRLPGRRPASRSAAPPARGGPGDLDDQCARHLRRRRLHGGRAQRRSPPSATGTRRPSPWTSTCAA